MSGLYSTSLKTQYLDPRVDISNRICEFRLDRDTAYYPNMMLAGLSANASAATAYQSLAGVYGLIRHARLMDGRTELDSVRFFNRFAAFQNLGNTNKRNVSVNGRLNKSSNGYVLQDTNRVLEAGSFLYSVESVTSGNHTEEEEGLLDLRQVLPILNNMTHLDTSIFKNLKVVIEWETDVNLLLDNNTRTLATRTPTLIVDELMDKGRLGELNSAQSQIVWNAIEHDVVQVADQVTAANAFGADTDTAEQSVNKQLNGYDNKVLGRVAMMKALSVATGNFHANAAQGAGAFSSYTQHNEKIQIRLNGRNVFPDEGLTKTSQKAMLLYQTWGECNIPPFGNQESIGLDQLGTACVNIDGVLGASTSNGQAASTNHKVGQYDFVGFDLGGARVNQLNIDYKRTNLKDDTSNIQRLNLGLDLHLYAEVARSLDIGGQDYNVKYL